MGRSVTASMTASDSATRYDDDPDDKSTVSPSAGVCTCRMLWIAQGTDMRLRTRIGGNDYGSTCLGTHPDNALCNGSTQSGSAGPGPRLSQTMCRCRDLLGGEQLEPFFCASYICLRNPSKSLNLTRRSPLRAVSSIRALTPP